MSAPSRSTTRGTRSWNLRGVRSSHNPAGSNTCESAETRFVDCGTASFMVLLVRRRWMSGGEHNHASAKSPDAGGVPFHNVIVTPCEADAPGVGAARKQ